MSVPGTTSSTILARDADGVIRLAGTRVSLDSVIWSFRSGESIEELADAFPELSPTEIEAAVSYYRENRQEVDEYLDSRSRAAEAVERGIERDFPEAYRRQVPKKAR